MGFGSSLTWLLLYNGYTYEATTSAQERTQCPGARSTGPRAVPAHRIAAAQDVLVKLTTMHCEQGRGSLSAGARAMTRTSLGTLSGLAAASIWGAMYVVSKLVLETIPPFVLITSRLVLGSVTLALILLCRGFHTISPRDFWRVIAVGMVGYGISLGFQFVGTKLSTAANGALVTSVTPAFVLVFAAFLLRERLTFVRVFALIISTLGVLAVVDPSTAKLDSSTFWGNMALLMAAITWALYSVLIRSVTREMDVLTVSVVAFLGGLPISVAAAGAEVFTVGVGPITMGVVVGVLFLGIVCTAGAMLLWNWAFARLEASRASLTFFAQPIVGTFLAWLFLKESISSLFLVGAGLIAVGLVLASYGGADQ